MSKFSLEELLIAHTEKTEKLYQDLDSRLDSIEKVLIKQELNLAIHIKRSDNLEALVQHIQEKDLKPMARHISMVEGGFKLIGLVALIVGIIGGIIKIFGL